MKTVKTVGIGTLGAVTMVALALFACGKPEPVNRTETGRLESGDSVLPQDNSLYDTYTVEAAEGATITLTMTSTEFDTYLHLLDKDGNVLAQNDDNAAAGGAGAMAGKNSQIIHTAPYSGTYTIYANAYQQGNQGAYSLSIVTTAGR